MGIVLKASGFRNTSAQSVFQAESPVHLMSARPVSEPAAGLPLQCTQLSEPIRAILSRQICCDACLTSLRSGRSSWI